MPFLLAGNRGFVSKGSYRSFNTAFYAAPGGRLMNNYHRIGFLRRKLGNRLFHHSLGVARIAGMLASVYKVDKEASFLAGLWHDYGKAFSPAELLKMAEDMRLELDDITRQSPHLAHAPVGAALVRRDAGIKDLRILRAIELHTTGDAGLGSLEKIIYLADAIEPGRSYPGVRKLRRTAFWDLDKTLRTVVDNTIKRVVQKGDLLHPRSVAFRNELVMEQH